MAKFTPENDGVDHINIYSKGKTILGRYLSNFTEAKIITEDGVFNSVEGYWYWLSSPDIPERDELRKLHGFEAKEFGRRIGSNEHGDTEEFRRKIKTAIEYKIRNSHCVRAFTKSTLPFSHYYVYNGKKVNAGFKWITIFVDSLRTTMKNELK